MSKLTKMNIDEFLDNYNYLFIYIKTKYSGNILPQMFFKQKKETDKINHIWFYQPKTKLVSLLNISDLPDMFKIFKDMINKICLDLLNIEKKELHVQEPNSSESKNESAEDIS